MSHVLIVEDNAELAAASETMFRSNGFSVAVASNSGDALEAMSNEEQPIDVVVLDLNLAGERGETLIRRAERFKIPLPSIIITSAEPRTDCAYALLELGAAACLTKPFSLEDLLAETRKAIADPQPHLA